jgi:hypothetical protein
MIRNDGETPAEAMLTCPGCGQGLSVQSSPPNSLGCPAGHEYTLESLLLAQSIRAESLLQAAIRFLEQQEGLVRRIAEQSWATRALQALRLEGQADRVAETIEEIRRILVHEPQLALPKSAAGPTLPN